MKIFTLLNSLTWLKLFAQATGVQSIIRSNQYGRKFLTLVGNTYPIKDKLGKSGLGFNFFKGTWSFPVDKIDDNIKSQLTSMGIDISVLNEVDEPQEVAIDSQRTEVNQETTDAAENNKIEPSVIEKELNRMKAGVEMAMKQEGSEKVKGLLSFVDRMIERVAQMTDEAAQSDFVKSFLYFSSKFHAYSFSNQMLIWVQNPKATYVRGFKQWMELGREVNNWDNGIVIVAPFFKKIKEEGDAEGKEERTMTYFQAVKVYDYADTKPIEGFDKKGRKPFEPTEWRKDSNEDIEEINAIINAIVKWANSSNISINYEKMAKEMGGYSAGGRIVLNDTYKGINLFSTFVHECAHEVLHWEKGTRAKESLNVTRQQREIDAETTAFIVLQHYGFETKDTPNYLALWKAKGEDVRRRRESISKAVKMIIDGIDKSMSGMKVEEAPVEDVTAKKKHLILKISKSQMAFLRKQF
jgi:hypothetical protein